MLKAAIQSPWIITYTGVKYYPLNPEPGMVVLEDIAHALANICRFNGHVRSHYSVAQHSILVSNLVPPQYALWGLLHDAAEAYCGDLVKPIKVEYEALGFPFKTMENLNLEAIKARFGLYGEFPESVWVADNIALATEARDMLCGDISWCSQKPVAFSVSPLPSPVYAESAFLHRFWELVEQ